MALYVLYSIVRGTIDVSANRERERSDYFSSQTEGGKGRH